MQGIKNNSDISDSPDANDPLESYKSAHSQDSRGSSNRLLAIQRAMNSHFPADTTHKKNFRNDRVIEISSDEEDNTDRGPLLGEEPLSSQPSTKTPFSSVSAGSSLASIEASSSQRKILGPKTSNKEGRPPIIQDVFYGPVVTTRTIRTIPTSKPQLLPLNVAEQPQDKDAISRNVLEFANSPFGTDLEIKIIAHSQDMQEIMDDNQIAWGVQYEIARGVAAGLWAWGDILVNDRIHKLLGTNEEAAVKVEGIMKSGDISGPSGDHHVWHQLDLEQAAIMENKGRGLGLMGEFQGVTDWYGGRIQQIGRLVKSGSGSFKIILERMESRRSNRFARYYGSRRFLQISVLEDYLQKEREAIKQFFKHKFILCGRVFLPFHAKGKNVYLVETNQDYDRLSQDWCGDQFRYTLNEFINWHNPLNIGKNVKQVISKYTARFALGISNSTPAVEFDEENIYFTDDLIGDDWPKEEKDAPAHKLMTDGCGFLNHAALRLIAQKVGYGSIPAGVQGRIDGSKGFFILHPTDMSTVPKVWIRDSQNKIMNHSFDRAHRIFDLLCPSQPSPPTIISKQSIINMFANGIPANVLVRLMEQGLEDDISPLVEWDGDDATLLLYDNISKCGGVPQNRAQRVAYSLNRILGLKRRDDDWKEYENEEGETGRNKYNGKPLGPHETVIELLQSGFHPKQNKFLQAELEAVVKLVINKSVEKCHIPIPESVWAFIVPDPLRVLEENEVCYHFSKPRKDLQTDLLYYALEGPILIGRYPILLPSDIQRVTAVHRRELDRWPDVLIVSTKGSRSIASLLADGDMDGDEVVVIYNKELVSLFKNQPFTSPPPRFIEENFTHDVEYVDEFCNRFAALPSRKAHELFQEELVAILSETRVGQYSLMHEKACIRYGYNSDQAVRLAYIFATLLDSSKNGYRLRRGVFENDEKKYWFISLRAQIPNAMDDILGILKSAAKQKGDELLMKYQSLGQGTEWKADDEALCHPFEIAKKTANTYHHYRKELDLIVAHVHEAEGIYLEAWRKHHDEKEKETPVKGKSSKFRKAKNKDVLADCIKKFAEPISGLQLIHNVEEVKASYAYSKRPKFAFQVAYRELCLLKAKSMPGGLVPVFQKFDEAKKISGLYMRALKANKE